MYITYNYDQTFKLETCNINTEFRPDHYFSIGFEKTPYNNSKGM